MDDEAVFELLSTVGMGPTPSQRFHSETKITAGSKATSREQWPEEWLTTYYKSYPRLPIHTLPNPKLPSKISLKKALVQRHSSWDFSSAITLSQISTLLYYSAGVKDPLLPDGPNRFYPSAGARYPLELYLVAWGIDGLVPGLYHYYVKEHALEELLCTPVIAQDFANCFIPDWIQAGKCALIVTSVFFRTQVKYNDRGYRHILLEAGHLSQNVALLASAVGVSCCSCGGFVDDAINAFLDIDGREEATISTTILG